MIVVVKIINQARKSIGILKLYPNRKGESDILKSPFMDLNRLNPIFESRLKIRQLTAHKIQVTQEKLRFIAKMDGPVVCYLNKYTIKSINSTDLI